MKTALFFLAALLALCASQRPKRIGWKSEQLSRYYQNMYKKTKMVYNKLRERNLELKPDNTTSVLLPTNITQVDLKPPEKFQMDEFLKSFAEGKLDPQLVHPKGTEPLVPLFNRFRVRKRMSKQMDCSLHIKPEGLHNYYEIGVVILRLTFSSSCRRDEHSQFIWMNSFDAVSHVQIQIGKLRYMFVFGSLTVEKSPYKSVAIFNSYKMLTLFRAKEYKHPYEQHLTKEHIESAQGKDKKSEKEKKGKKSKNDKSKKEKKVKKEKEENKKERRLNDNLAPKKRKLRDHKGMATSVEKVDEEIKKLGSTLSISPPNLTDEDSAPISKTMDERSLASKSDVVKKRGASSFGNLINKNDESRSVFTGRVFEPVNVLPRIGWRRIGRRREVLYGKEIDVPSWSYKTIKRIWGTKNPYLTNPKPIKRFKDGIIKLKF